MRFHRTDEMGIIVDGAAYRQFLDANRQSLPAGVREFVFCDWFHDWDDPRCPHDAWLESLTIKELPADARHEERSVEVTARFLGAYHDGFFEMIYLGVTSYSLDGGSACAGGTLHGHGDWLMDEIACEGNGVSHEILFSSSSRWIIRCADMRYKWLPK